MCVYSFSECIHAKAVQAACHISVVLQVESECVSFEFVYACIFVSACLHKSPCVGVCACMSVSM